MNFTKQRATRMVSAAALVAACFTSMASANLMHVSTIGSGQVLLFPYYTTRNDTVSLLSLVNTSVSAKAVRINVREARGGFIVARLNVYLSAKDVWTAAIIPDGEGAKLVTTDTSCTAPLVGTGLAFDNAPYASAASTLPEAPRSRDRTREGYLEVIEMAAIPNATKTGVLVTHVNGVPNCDRDPPFTLPKPSKLTDATYEPPAADLRPPIGQLTGTLSLVNVGQGMLASTAPTVIENFWRTDAAAAAPRVWAATATAPDLTSGGNRFVDLPRYNTDTTVASESQYVAEFASSIDAVSALFTAPKVSSEYAHTRDAVISTQAVLTFPTRPYYVFASSPSPFQQLWNAETARSCDEYGYLTFDREEGVAASWVNALDRPYIPPPVACYGANPIYFGSGGMLGSTLGTAINGIQYGGVEVISPGREGGWLELQFLGTRAKLTAVAASSVKRVAGVLTLTPVSLTLQGLPVIGFTMSQSAYKTGSPQQNYGDIVPLRREPSYQEAR